MAHTAGPWTLDDSVKEAWTRIRGADDEPIADVFGLDRDDDGDEANANANLLLAAPDLLEACEYTLKIIGDVEEAEDNEEWVRAIHAKLRPAIAKAKGTT